MTYTQRTLYHVHDPMCSWCYAFRPLWKELQAELPEDIKVEYVLGGLAPDSDVPMAETMQQGLISTWQRITEVVPGTTFNFDFWTENQPRRSTYPSCRAVLAARAQNPEREKAMIEEIQNAYYREAKNPSNADTLIGVAESLGLNPTQFANDLESAETRQALLDEISFARSIGGDSFPSLILKENNTLRLIMLSYTDKKKLLQQF